jgi:hypothetical protein
VEQRGNEDAIVQAVEEANIEKVIKPRKSLSKLSKDSVNHCTRVIAMNLIVIMMQPTPIATQPQVAFETASEAAQVRVQGALRPIRMATDLPRQISQARPPSKLNVGINAETDSSTSRVKVDSSKSRVKVESRLPAALPPVSTNKPKLHVKAGRFWVVIISSLLLLLSVALFASFDRKYLPDTVVRSVDIFRASLRYKVPVTHSIDDSIESSASDASTANSTEAEVYPATITQSVEEKYEAQIDAEAVFKPENWTEDIVDDEDSLAFIQSESEQKVELEERMSTTKDPQFQEGGNSEDVTHDDVSGPVVHLKVVEDLAENLEMEKLRLLEELLDARGEGSRSDPLDGLESRAQELSAELTEDGDEEIEQEEEVEALESALEEFTAELDTIQREDDFHAQVLELRVDNEQGTQSLVELEANLGAVEVLNARMQDEVGRISLALDAEELGEEVINRLEAAVQIIESTADEISFAVLEEQERFVSTVDLLAPEPEAVNEEMVVHAEELLSPGPPLRHLLSERLQELRADLSTELAAISVDHAVSVRGGHVVVRDSSLSKQPLTSPSYVSSLSPLMLVKHLVSPLKAEADPSIVISHAMPMFGPNRAFLRQCYCFKGAEGNITVSLQKPVVVDYLQIFHLGLAESSPAYRGSAPRHFSVKGYDANGIAVNLGSFVYSTAADFEELQSFPVSSRTSMVPVRALTFLFSSNAGAPYTCVYRIKAIGKPPHI